MRRKITQKAMADAARDAAPGERVVLTDTVQAGFGARLGVNGWTFTINYTARDGRRVRNRSLPAWIKTPEDARAWVERKRGAAKDEAPEVDPDAAVRFKALLDHYLAHAKRRTKTWKNAEYRVKRHLRQWDDIPAEEITRERVLALVHHIGEEPCGWSRCQHGGQEKCTGHKAMATSILKNVHRIYELAQKAGLVARGFNPAEDTRDHIYKAPAKHDRSATAQEVQKLRDALWSFRSWAFRALIWLCLLTAMRRGECSRLQWTHVNLGTEEIPLPGRWKLPGKSFFLAADETKSERPAIFPLSKAAIELLLALPKETPWVIPGKIDHLRSFGKQWEKIRVDAGAPELKIHDLRATVSTMMARVRVDYRVRRAVLNHAPLADVTDRIYTDAPHPEDELRGPLEAHGRAILKAAGVKSGAQLVLAPKDKPKKIVALRF